MIQARIWATRFPAKVLSDLGGETVLQHLIRRCQQIKGVDKVIVATPDLALVPLIQRYGAKAFLGSEKNVLKRYVDCALAWNLDSVVRLTGDCPFVDPRVVSELVTLWRNGNYDYVSNVLERSYPYGLDSEIVSRKALQGILDCTQEMKYREHVTLYIREHLHGYKTANLAHDKDYTAHDWRLDRPEDLPALRHLYSKCGGNVLYSFVDMLRLWMYAKHLRVPTWTWGTASGDSTPYGVHEEPADKSAHKPGLPWYERGSGEPPPGKKPA